MIRQGFIYFLGGLKMELRIDKVTKVFKDLKAVKGVDSNYSFS